jgi:hypothetical protein
MSGAKIRRCDLRYSAQGVRIGYSFVARDGFDEIVTLLCCHQKSPVQAFSP